MELRGTEWHTPDNGPVFPDAEFPLAPEFVRDAYRLFWEKANYSTDDIREKQKDLALTNTLIADFCDEYLNASVYTATMLGPIFDAQSDPDPTVAAAAYQTFVSYVQDKHNTPETVLYILGLLSDRPVIDNFWKQKVTDLYSEQPELQEHLLTQSASTVPVELWWRAKLVPPKEMLALAKNVNIETLLTESVETLVRLGLDKVRDDSATLQQVYKAESLLSPLCHVIGFDGLDMALSSREHTLKAIFTGELELLERITNAVEAEGSADEYTQRVQSLFLALFGDSIHEQVVKHTAQHGVMIGEGLCTANNLRVTWRRKTIGSRVEKILHSESAGEETLSDELGATVICDSIEEVGEQLALLIENAHNDHRVRLVPTASRTDAIHISGERAYVEKVRMALGFDSIEAMERFVDVKIAEPHEYHVSKATIVYSEDGKDDLRAEVQFLTKADRAHARTGMTAHIFHKYSKYIPDDSDQISLEDIFVRKPNLSEHADHLNPASLERSVKLYQEYLNA